MVSGGQSLERRQSGTAIEASSRWIENPGTLNIYGASDPSSTGTPPYKPAISGKRFQPARHVMIQGPVHDLARRGPRAGLDPSTLLRSSAILACLTVFGPGAKPPEIFIIFGPAPFLCNR